MACFAVLPSHSQAAEIVWLELVGYLSYRDLGTYCYTDPLGGVRLHLSLEIEGNEVTRANLVKSSASSFKQSFALGGDEAAGIRLHRDPYGRFWVTDLPLSSRAVAWTLARMEDMLCKVPQSVQTVSPSPLLFPFSLEPLTAGGVYLRSPVVKMQGQLVGGRAFSAELRFAQSQYPVIGYE